MAIVTIAVIVFTFSGCSATPYQRDVKLRDQSKPFDTTRWLYYDHKALMELRCHCDLTNYVDNYYE